MSEAIIEALRRRYMESVGNPARQLIGGGVRGYLGLDMPEYADQLGREAYANAQALGNAPGIGAPAGAFKAMAAAPLMVKALRRAPRDEALEVARQNAVKMLGLPENNTAMDRAKALAVKQQASDIPLELIAGPSKYLQDAYALGQKARVVKPDLNEWAYGYYAKELGPYPWQTERGPAWNAFFEAGRKGYEQPPMATGYRYGRIPESGRSWNYRDDMPESGVSMAEVDHPLASEWSDTISKMFIKGQQRPRVDVGGYLHTVSVGADGEPLLVGARKLQGDFVIPASGQSRSRHAAFDPARVNENDLLGRADPRLLGLIAAGTATGATVAALRNKKEDEKKKKKE